ncbi:predicted protein [Sclerotinia sclerotiorum 1980 UF-70]|uniref:Uncharacterized protein n=1 Tax=Sclerotinia sclerotiorum (strain ATCC 18683 / 1980 / Ss-1) TaxID=665079 RepID=A7ERD4_SCLS1|nr:predicted protein [Sclerotinia sclerotiorum 1980 UF-70]EDN92026.1 predicted protein [Sclerotinia sclerotiorum 1980 UF-70]
MAPWVQSSSDSALLATAMARLVLNLWKLYEAVTCAMTAAMVQEAGSSSLPMLSSYLSDVHQMTPR